MKLVAYFSCMTLFNLILILRMTIINIDIDKVQIKNLNTVEGIVLYTIIILVALIGLICSLILLFYDDSPKSSQTKGIEYKIKDVKDMTSEYYFGNFSLIVLTSLAIPLKEMIARSIIYLLIMIVLGIVYCNKNMIYMNPILTLFKYSVYNCILEQKTPKSVGEDYNNSKKQLNKIIITNIPYFNENNKVTIKNIEKNVLLIKNKKSKIKM